MPLVCSLCPRVFPSSKAFLTHLRLEHAVHYVGSTVQCGQDGCPRSFQNFRYFKSHLEKHHACLLSGANEGDYMYQSGNAQSPQLVDDDVMDTDDSSGRTGEQPCFTGVNLTSSFMTFIGQLEAKSNFTQANVQTVLDNFKILLTDVSEFCTEKVKTLLLQLDVPLSTAAVQTCLHAIGCVPDSLTAVDTEYKRTQYLKQSGTLIEPVEHVLSTRTEFRYAASAGYHVPRVVEDTMQYVPLERLLGALMLNDRYCQIITNAGDGTSFENNDVVRHYFHTNSFKQHPFFQKYPDGLALNLYVDAFETTNVLGSHTGVHKLEGLYMVVQNFHPAYQSQLSSIFLVALWYAHDAKTYGYSKILEPVVSSLLKLESDEGAVVCVGAREVVVRACLVFISADNLGFHSLFGFCETFSATRFCRFCDCTREDADTLFSESQLRLRTKDSYDEAVSLIGTSQHNVQLTGIKRSCPLNALHHWHVTENFVVDVMHDILEGIAPFELSLIFNKLSQDKQCNFSLEKLNSAITSFNYSLADKNSQPPTVLCCNSIRMTASEMWCFLRNLPLLIGGLIPRDQPHWRLLLMLLDITDIVFAPAITENLSNFLSHLVEEHHCYFKELFPDRQLLPKHHFLVHYPRCLKMSGPPVRYWSMRFEGRHQIFKDMARATNCFKNLCKTLAKRFQRGLSYRLISRSFSDVCETGPAEEVVVKDFAASVCETICSATNVCQNDTVFSVSWVKIGHYTFKPTAVAVHAMSDGLPQFGVVTDIVSINKKIYVILDLLDTLCYDEHFHAFVLKHPCRGSHVCVLLQRLKDHIPLQYHVIKYEGEQTMFISLRYDIF